MAIMMANEEKKISTANNQTTKTPSKYIEVYELRGHLPETWLDEEGDKYNYTPQMHLVCFYNDSKGVKNGINPHTQKRQNFPPMTKVSFKPVKKLKEDIQLWKK